MLSVRPATRKSKKSFGLINSPSAPLLAHLLHLDLIALNGQGKTVLAARCHRKRWAESEKIHLGRSAPQSSSHFYSASLRGACCLPRINRPVEKRTNKESTSVECNQCLLRNLSEALMTNLQPEKLVLQMRSPTQMDASELARKREIVGSVS